MIKLAVYVENGVVQEIVGNPSDGEFDIVVLDMDEESASEDNDQLTTEEIMIFADGQTVQEWKQSSITREIY